MNSIDKDLGIKDGIHNMGSLQYFLQTRRTHQILRWSRRVLKLRPKSCQAKIKTLPSRTTHSRTQLRKHFQTLGNNWRLRLRKSSQRNRRSLVIEITITAMWMRGQKIMSMTTIERWRCRSFPPCSATSP